MVADVRRAGGIIDRVSSLYRRGTPERELVDLNEIIREMSVLLGDTANRNAVSIRTGLDPALPTTIADRVQLQQVLMNLMLNGIEAMQDSRGELTIASKRTEDGQLLISVSDTGIGLSIDEAERIFEAFFTTKPRGTGMGLSISSADHRVSWRPFVGEPQHRTGCHLSVHAATGDATRARERCDRVAALLFAVQNSGSSTSRLLEGGSLVVQD